METSNQNTAPLAWELFGPGKGETSLQMWLKERGPELRREAPKQPVIYIGTGTCGLGAGAGKSLEVIRAWLESHDVEAETVELGCVGLCSAEPLVDIHLPGKARLALSAVTPDAVVDIMDAIFNGALPEEHLLGQLPAAGELHWEGVPLLEDHPFFKPQRRRVLTRCGRNDPTRIEEYLATGGYRAFAETLHGMTREEVCAEVEKSGLRGRGGGGFLTGRKWRFALDTPAERKYLICNADEGDPGAFMDRALIEGDPYRLLEGLALAAYGIGATKAYIYIRAEYPLAIARLEHAIAEARRWGFLGLNILDSGMDFDIQLKKGAGAFVCGEETALIHSIEGKRGMPRPRPPFPAKRGLFGKPTIINNVETLANLPEILPNGAEDFASVGTDTSRGTKVFALSGKVSRTGLIEVEMGTTVREIVFDIGGGVPDERAFKAVQMGGPSGGCIPSQHLDIEVDYESLKTVGAMMGSGGLVVMDEETCMVDVACFFMEFIQRESCGKCIPCREGTRKMMQTLESITRSRRGEKGEDALMRFKGVMDLEALAKVIQDTSLCGLGQSAPNPVLSTLRWFRDEYEAHVFERRCPAGVCSELKTYTIDESRCVGCMLCARKCPVDAIKGARKSPHYILEDRCIACGVCQEVCRFGAVEVQ